MNRSYRPRLAALLLAQMSLVPAFAGTTWDGGAAPDTNISNAVNWDLDTLPDLTGPSSLTFGTASGTATVDVPVEATRISLTNSFTVAAGAGTLTVRGTSSGGNAYGLLATSAAANAVIDEPILVKVGTPAPLGSILLVYNNRTTSNTTTFRINGGIALAPGSTSTSYSLRYGTNTSLSVNTSDTRIAGPITGLNTLQNSSAGGQWAGDLIIAGTQSGLASTDITISSSASGFQSPTATARLVLGETKDDVQTWRNVTLNNVMNIAVGGNITINGLSTSTTAATKVTGTAADLATAGTLTIGNGTVNTVCVIGGSGTNENNLHIAKNTTGTLTLNGAHTYLGNTTVNAGTLVLNGTLASPVVVNAGATLSGEGSTTGSLTFGAGSSTLLFDPNTQTASLSAATLSATGATVVVSPSTSVTAGTAYTVLKLTGGTFSGNPADSFLLASRGGSLSYTAGNTELTLTAGAASGATLIWTGANGTNPTFWDAATTINWTNGGSPDRYYAGDNVVFDDTAASTAVAIQTATVSPGAITFNNSAKNYTLSGGAITGTASLTKSGTGTVSITTTGTSNYSGGLVMNDGTLEFTGLNQLGSTTAPAVQINGGTLRLNGGTSTGGPAMTFNAPATIDVAGSASVTLRLAGKLSGSGNITKSGPGALALGTVVDTTPGNDFTGTVTVTAGALDVRQFDSLGSTAAGTSIQGATLLIQNFGQTAGIKTFNPEPLAFSGTSYLTVLNQEAKAFTDQLTGPITASGTLNLATAISTGATAPVLDLTNTASIATADASTSVVFGVRSTFLTGLGTANQTINVSAPISGPGSVVVNAGTGSLVTFDAAHTYTGATSILSGSLKLITDSLPSATTLTIASTGATLDLVASDTVDKLFVGTTQLDAGVYKAVGNTGATGTELAQLTGTGTLTVTTGPIVATPYETWAAGFGLTGNAALAASDPDGDGLSNILEYATNSSPVVAGPGNVTLARSGDFLSLTYTRVADGSLTYTVEGTNDLAGTWTTVTASGNPSTGSANVAGNVTITDTVSLTSSAKRFLRLRVNY